MTRQPLLARRAEQLLGVPVTSTAPLAGGDVCTATKLRLNDGSLAVMKTMSQAPPGFFAAEARGLSWLAEATAAGGVPVPEVLAAEHDCLVLRWIEHGRPGVEAAERLGRGLAALHAAGPGGSAGTGTFGAAADGYIGRLPMPNGPTTGSGSWAEFYAARRVLPYLRLARDRGAVEDDDAAAVEALVGRLPGLVPEEPPARLHGDLWNGNVVWSADGDAWLVDPAAHAGHRETDLAMLALFGLPHLERVQAAYAEAAETTAPLTDGWRERAGIHQLFPLLVHAATFGGGYGARAAAVARAYL